MRDQAYPSLWETQPLYTLGGCVGGLVLADLALVPLSARVGGLLSGHGVGTTSGLPLPTTLTHAVADGIESTWHISPAAFWVGHVLCTIVLLAIIALGLRTWRRLFKTDRQSIEQSLRDSSSVWASAADVESAGLVIADPQRRVSSSAISTSPESVVIRSSPHLRVSPASSSHRRARARPPER